MLIKKDTLRHNNIIKHYEHKPRYLQLPHWQFGPDQVLIEFLKIERLAEFLISLGSLFQIFGPKLLRV